MYFFFEQLNSYMFFSRFDKTKKILDLSVKQPIDLIFMVKPIFYKCRTIVTCIENMF